MYLTYIQLFSLKRIIRKAYCAFSVFIHENLMRTYERLYYNFMICYT